MDIFKAGSLKNILRRYLIDYRHCNRSATLSAISEVVAYDRTYISRLLNGKKDSEKALIHIIRKLVPSFIIDKKVIAEGRELLDKILIAYYMDDDLSLFEDRFMENKTIFLDSSLRYRYMFYDILLMDEDKDFSECASLIEDGVIDSDDIGMFHLVLAKRYLDARSYEQAKECCLKTLSFGSNDLICALACHRLSIVLSFLEDYHEAIDNAKRAKRAYEIYGAHKRIESIDLILGVLYQYTKEDKKAIDLYKGLLEAKDVTIISKAFEQLLFAYIKNDTRYEAYRLIEQKPNDADTYEINNLILCYSYIFDDHELFERQSLLLASQEGHAPYTYITQMLEKIKKGDDCKVQESLDKIMKDIDKEDDEYFIIDKIMLHYHGDDHRI